MTKENKGKTHQTPDPAKFDAPPQDGELMSPASIAAQLADLKDTIGLQAAEIAKMKQPKGIQTANQAVKPQDVPASERELAEMELRKYVKKGGWTKDPRTDKLIEVQPGFRKNLSKDKVKRAKQLIEQLNKLAGKDDKKRNPQKPEWDLNILDADHKRTQV